jgi:hypothetical protein
MNAIRKYMLASLLMFAMLLASCGQQQNRLLIISQSPAALPTDFLTYRKIDDFIAQGIQKNAGLVKRISLVETHTRTSLWNSEAKQFNIPDGIDCDKLPKEEVEKLGLKKLFKKYLDEALKEHQTKCGEMKRANSGPFKEMSQRIESLKKELSATTDKPVPCLNYNELVGRIKTENAPYNLLIVNGVIGEKCPKFQEIKPYIPSNSSMRMVIVLLPTSGRNADYASRYESVRKVFPTAKILPAISSADAIDILYGLKEAPPFDAAGGNVKK